MPRKKESSREEKAIESPVTSLPAILPLPDDFQGGKYANHVTVGRTQWEFYLDFWRLDADAATKTAKPSLVERIILSPHNVKGLVDAVREVVEGFERDWDISLPNMRGAKPKSQKEE